MALSIPASEVLFISVVIPTYNRPASLRDAILSLYAQDYPKDRYEVIIIDDGSEDSTADVVSRLDREVPRLHYEKQANQGAAAARNRGARLAQGDILLYTDDDCAPDPACLSSVARAMELNPSAGMIACRIVEAQKGLLAKCHTISQYSALSSTYPGKISYACGSGMAVRKDLFDQAGGFNETYQVAEDEELSLRLREKGSGIAEKEPITWEDESLIPEDLVHDA
ncbi:MAG: glycosyltransferase family 2 protein, partial [Dehalococcoidia bacterium]|nr:glycosyltransferase family 2 protein [Dehalococcoidia bacterium]